MKEGDFNQKLIKLLEPNGFTFKIAGGLYQQNGLPDICHIWRGLFVGIEVKMGTNTMSKLQQARLKQIRNSKGIAICYYVHKKTEIIVEGLKVYQFNKELTYEQFEEIFKSEFLEVNRISKEEAMAVYGWEVQ